MQLAPLPAHALKEPRAAFKPVSTGHQHHAPEATLLEGSSLVGRFALRVRDLHGETSTLSLLPDASSDQHPKTDHLVTHSDLLVASV